MSLGKLSNCSRCGALFVQVVRDICPTCHQTIEKEYERCASYLRKRENRGATIYQLSEATGVSVKQITRFIRERRISIANNPNMGYPCERCGSLIRSDSIVTTAPSICSGISCRILTLSGAWKKKRGSAWRRLPIEESRIVTNSFRGKN